MLPSTIVRALTTPAFEPDHFTATQWSTTEDKAKFANALMKFIAHEFPRQSFSKTLYQRLSNTFGHIAHTNQDGYYSVFFERDADKVVFLDQTLRWPCYGDPTYTFCDVECAVQRRLRAANVIDVAPTASLPRPRSKPRRRRLTCSRHDAENRPREKKMTEKARGARAPQRAGSSRRSRWAARIPALRAAFAPAGTPAL